MHFVLLPNGMLRRLTLSAGPKTRFLGSAKIRVTRLSGWLGPDALLLSPILWSSRDTSIAILALLRWSRARAHAPTSLSRCSRKASWSAVLLFIGRKYC